MFTTAAPAGRSWAQSSANGTIQSDVAEVAWFVRGRTLHRRVLLVAPKLNLLHRITAAELLRRQRHFRPDVGGVPCYQTHWAT